MGLIAGRFHDNAVELWDYLLVVDAVSFQQVGGD